MRLCRLESEQKICKLNMFCALMLCTGGTYTNFFSLKSENVFTLTFNLHHLKKSYERGDFILCHPRTFYIDSQKLVSINVYKIHLAIALDYYHQLYTGMFEDTCNNAL